MELRLINRKSKVMLNGIFIVCCLAAQLCGMWEGQTFTKNAMKRLMKG